MGHVSSDYDEDRLLLDREWGTVSPRQRPSREEGQTFRESWGVDQHLALPVGLPAGLVNRYIDALTFAAEGLAAYASTEWTDHDFDRRRVVYAQGYEPSRDAFDAVIDTVFPSREIEIEVDGQADYVLIDVMEEKAQATVGLTFPMTAEQDRRVAVEERRLRAEAIRSLIAPGDASYTPAAPGSRYTRIRVDLGTGHLSAHTDQDPDAPESQTVDEWEVPELHFRQANRVIRALGTDALRIVSESPTVVVPDAWERIRAGLESLVVTDEEVAAVLGGAKATAAARRRARRRLVAERVDAL